MRAATSAAAALGATSALVNAQALSWSDSYTKAQSALSKLSLQDKVNVVSGIGWNAGGPCVGNTAAISSISYPELCLQDGPLGVRFSSHNTAFTPGVQAASTWDLELVRQRGQFYGAEAKAAGINVVLGPVAGPLGKIPNGGRNWEGFSPDPYLTGLCMAETIEGLQSSGVQATAKHFILNEQEKSRTEISSNIDDRTMHELYLWPFADAVHSNVSAVMCSYNKINGTWACESEYVMNTLLKKELGFPGYIMTDWAAQHSTEQAANTGLDMSMPGTDMNNGGVYWQQALVDAVNAGSVKQDRVDDMVTRILAAWYMLGQDSEYPSININADAAGNHKTNVRAVARDGIVLLKNDDSTLPLNKPSSIAIIGSAAISGKHAQNGCYDKSCDDGALGMGWGSGSVNYPYFVAPYDAINDRANAEGTTITLSSTDTPSDGASAAQGKSVSLVFLTADSGEEYITVDGNAGDRNDLDPWHGGNDLVTAVAGASDNVIVVVHSVGPLVLETILALPSVKAVVWAGLPSQESGNALVDILYGDVSPSGKLVYTIGKSQGDYGTSISSGDSDNFDEGLYIDYRHFDEANIEPRYEFGFGLSYTNFTYSNILVDSSATAGASVGEIVPGGASDLFDSVATVTCTIANSGSVAGSEVAQLYLGLPVSAPATAARQLRGFAKLPLDAGESGTATFNLRRRDLSYWDTDKQSWIVPCGDFTISIGASSREIRLTGKLTVKRK